MFGIGFGELFLLMIIGLIFLGPERLPLAMVAIIRWIKVLRALLYKAQNDLEKELNSNVKQNNLDLLNLKSKAEISINEITDAEILHNNFKKKPKK